MKPWTLDAIKASLTARFGDEQVRATQDAGRWYFRISDAELPPRCTPSKMDVLVEVATSPSLPRCFTKGEIKMPNGKPPRNHYAPQTVAGEAWRPYSVKIQWDPNQHLMSQFVDGALQRFAHD